VADGPGPSRRSRGNIEPRAGGFRVRVYAGIDPITKKAHYLRRTIPAGPNASREAERVLTKLLNQVDERRAPRTSASLNQLLDRYFDVGLDVVPSTRQDYISKVRKHVRPFVGNEPIARIDAELLESLYADLRKCNEHCHGRQYVQHRTDRPHTCDEHTGPRCDPPDPTCKSCTRLCGPHRCKPFKDSGIRTIHWILSGAFEAAVRWGWLGVNPAAVARKPAVPPARPRPPSLEEAARLVNEAWARDPDWGTFVWTATTTGARRGEMCALRWSHLDLKAGVIHLSRAIGKGDNDDWIDKDTKSHQERRVVLDQATVVVLFAHRARCEMQLLELSTPFNENSYVFSLAPDHHSFLIPDTATHRYDRMAKRLGITTTLHKLRAYAVTELLNGGMDIRAVAGRVGHGSGGAMTLRAYAAWLAEADQRAAPILAGRMPDLPSGVESHGDNRPTAIAQIPDDNEEPAGPYLRIARDLQGAIAAGLLNPGEPIPTVKELAARYCVAVGTAHRAVAFLHECGLVDASRGRRTTVRASA
jgi:integrase